MAKETEKTMIQEENTAGEGAAVFSSEDEDNSLLIKFKKPYKFEGKEYTELDLSGLDNLSASDMIAVDNYMKRTAATAVNVMPEVSIEYACVFASKATQLPVEFFTSLPPKEAMKVKNRVMGFLFGSD
jgi:hypothetical protein